MNNTTTNYTAAALAATSATWSLTVGQLWPAVLAVLAAGIIAISTIRREKR